MSFYADVICKAPEYHSTIRVSSLALLEPITRAAVVAIVAEANAAGNHCDVFETYRSQELQEIYFKRGATTLETVGVHHYGLACDIVCRVAGDWSWKPSYAFLGPLAKKHGLIWGGNWSRFKDMDHVQRIILDDETRLFANAWYPPDAYTPATALA